MEPPQKPQTNLFDVYLRLRPSHAVVDSADKFLLVEEPEEEGVAPTHITLNPPNDRRRPVEKFAFTRVFEEDATQLDVFQGTKVLPLVEGALAPHGGDGTDGLLATLGMTGSGKTHTMLGSRTQRGLTQLALDVVFRSISSNMVDCDMSPALEASIQSSDASEANICQASAFLESTFGDMRSSRAGSRAATPMIGDHPSSQTPRRQLQPPSALPQIPDISSIQTSCDPSAEYAIVISMYEVYNDRIFDLLTPPVKLNATKEYRRRPLLFKCTETSPDRKVVAGLRKVICSSFQEALMVLEAGLHERRVAGTGSNSVSSRSHGFFCIEIKKRRRGRANGPWGTSTLSIVDLAGSERARDAKTQGATLVEGGKINESLMYLGQCLQMQTDLNNNSKPNLRLFRQCKLTELLFTNSFPSATSSSHASSTSRRAPQKAVMIVTADPSGDFNATSQILRYSALAREVTVPRIPSITSTMHATGASMNQSQQHPQSELSSSPPILSSPLSAATPSFRRGHFYHRSDATATTSTTMHHISRTRTFSPVSPNVTERGTMENAALEIARMADEIEQLRAELAREAAARMAAEADLDALEDRLGEFEQEIREECHAAFEHRLAMEMSRLKASLSLEQERGEEHWDRKVEVLSRSVVGVVVTAPSEEGGDVYEDDDFDVVGNVVVDGVGNGNATGNDDEDKENILVENLEEENERLRREVAVLKRELAGRTPSRRAPLRERGDVPSSKGSPAAASSSGATGEVASLGGKLEQLRVSGSGNGSPTKTKKVRKLGAKKWENVPQDDDLF
ncbi:P-loop containing nucleoside triphosphate hydrolase protein [Xylariaceae sp. FL0594]|nr:P-loop containing nucleoside triphosphate hydrolase protein [Xylariaceae sp. FL0594]